MKKNNFRWLKIVIMFTAALVLHCITCRKNFCFIPKKLNSDYVFQFDMPFEEVNIPLIKTDTINMIKFFPTDSCQKRRCGLLSWQ